MAVCLPQKLPTGIDVFSRDMPPFEAITVPFNRKLHQRPQWVVLPKSVEQIQQTVQASEALGLTIGVRGAGFGAQSSLATDLLLDLRYLNTLEIFPDQYRVRFQGGVVVGQLDQATAAIQLAAVAPRVAALNMAGVCLGGGTGLLGPKYGFAAAHIQRAQMVTTGGQIVDVDQASHPRLLWALKGAGQNNFGVVTELEVHLHPVPSQVWGGTIQWPMAQAPRIFIELTAIQALYGEALSLDFSLRNHSPHGPICELFGGYWGDPSEGKAVFRRLERLLPPSYQDHGLTTYLELQHHFCVPPELKLSFSWHHGFVADHCEHRLLDILVAQMLAHPELALRVKLEPVGAQDQHPTCRIQHAASRYLYVMAGLWLTHPQARMVQQCLTSVSGQVQGLLTGQGHPNYHDHCIADPLTYYFGDQVPALLELKRYWDPDHRFQGFLNVRSGPVPSRGA